MLINAPVSSGILPIIPSLQLPGLIVRYKRHSSIRKEKYINIYIISGCEVKLDAKEQLDKARERVIEAIAQNIHLYGVTPSAGRLYGMMFFHHEPLTLDDMKEELGMSKTSMSTAVRSLSDLKMVERVWKKGIRKDLYKAEEDWYQSFIDLFSTKWRIAISLHGQALRRSLSDLRKLVSEENLDEDVKNLAQQDIDKLEYVLEYNEWLGRLIDSFESHEIFDLVPKKPFQGVQNREQ